MPAKPDGMDGLVLRMRRFDHVMVNAKHAYDVLAITIVMAIFIISSLGSGKELGAVAGLLVPVTLWLLCTGMAVWFRRMIFEQILFRDFLVRVDSGGIHVGSAHHTWADLTSIHWILKPRVASLVLVDNGEEHRFEFATGPDGATLECRLWLERHAWQAIDNAGHRTEIPHSLAAVRRGVPETT